MSQITLISKLWCMTNKDKLTTWCLDVGFYSCAGCLRGKKHMKAIDQHIYPIFNNVTDFLCTRTVCFPSHFLGMCGNMSVSLFGFGSQDSLNVKWRKNGAVCHQLILTWLLAIIIISSIIDENDDNLRKHPVTILSVRSVSENQFTLSTNLPILELNDLSEAK